MLCRVRLCDLTVNSDFCRALALSVRSSAAKPNRRVSRQGIIDAEDVLPQPAMLFGHFKGSFEFISGTNSVAVVVDGTTLASWDTEVRRRANADQS